MPKCCGKMVTTKFCPECGRAAMDVPALTLLHHIRAGLRTLEQHYAKWKPNNPEKANVKLEKYKEWESFVLRHMQEEDSK